MQDGSGGGEPTATLRAIDWVSRIERRLKGSAPQHAREQWLVPGLDARRSRAFIDYFPLEPIPAAVLVPIVVHPREPAVLLTQRATQLRHHAGQVSFPGGRMEHGDASPRSAALREAREEIGLDERFVRVVGYLPDHVVISGFRVTPVVALVQPGFELLLDAEEVQDTFEVPLSFVFDPRNYRPRRHRFRATNVEVELLDIPYGGRNIWGATAGMLVTLHRMCHEEGD